ncbi:FAD-dependent monooxygenase [Hymenobacter taeanensis]|uniref:Kynurenine 3-monooxygenase n=1 Tax=Hymenobacter taeanensis TaxID=2735321 RepID=A0A6M6BG40_9BACT|nr:MULTISPECIES: NAD(P)/FAD-dependent oxidoreductase [Hymenobacter]QJX46939.1 FAD-dependent monooxygenase [Hymenobacter taeanensis]UOQ80815.1 FAD-dependent monooxygenase [Hymenobacter sp. 5414T-23]
MSAATLATPNTDNEPMTVVGGGLVGSLLALYLARHGHTVQVFERRPDPRSSESLEGRSINLALSDRGWRALQGIGVEEAVREVAIPLYRRVMHDQRGQLTMQPYGHAEQAIYSVSRAGLNKRLLDLVDQEPRVEVLFNQQCRRVDLRSRTLEMFDAAAGNSQVHTYRHLFGTDGAYSSVRAAMQKTDRFNYSQQYLNYGYKELTIAAGPNNSWAIEKNALHIWPRGQYMMIALPNLDGSFNCTLFFPYEGPNSFETLLTPAQVRGFFEEVFPDAVPLMPELEQEFFENPTSSLVTVRCYPWSVADEVLLLGDASHAIVPFYGQGMNAGFEDCTILQELMTRHGDNWLTIFQEFQQQRKPNADAMADLAVYNFEEMRDRVADPRFLLQKKIESKISAQYPQQWLPLYSQVTFSHLPYAEAWANGQAQERIMQRIMPHIQTEADFELPEVQALIAQELAHRE